jgi:hypothetical protein
LNRLDEAQATVDQAIAQKVDTPALPLLLYNLAFLQNNPAMMKQKLASMRGKPQEEWLLSAQSFTEAYYGRLQASREFTHQAVDSAKRNETQEVAARYEADAAVREAEFGNDAEARRLSTAALALFPGGQGVRLRAAAGLALAGDASGAKKLAGQLNADFPLDTIVQGFWLPTIHAAIELSHGSSAKAIELLQPASSYELGGDLFPAYVRGVAYLAAHDGKAAAAEFQKLLDHRGIVLNAPHGALAHLQLGRAYVLTGETSKANSAYQDFFALWKDADSDIPILKQAKAEYAKLQ